MSKLLLFDLDGTLLSTSGAGMRAMARAGAELFGERFTFDGIPPAGQLDPHLFDAAARQSGVQTTPRQLSEFIEAYSRFLPDQLRSKETPVRVLPGVTALLGALSTHPKVTLGLLTGNYSRTGPIKLRTAGIDPAMFAVACWGDEATARPDLVPLAVSRYVALHRRRPPAHHVVVIGDTPRDVEAAHAHGAICVAVATGPFTVEQLTDTGAEFVLPDLSDPAALWELIDSD